MSRFLIRVIAFLLISSLVFDHGVVLAMNIPCESRELCAIDGSKRFVEQAIVARVLSPFFGVGERSILCPFVAQRTSLARSQPASLLSPHWMVALFVSPWLEEGLRACTYWFKRTCPGWGDAAYLVFNVLFVLAHYARNRSTFIERYWKRYKQMPSEWEIIKGTMLTPFIVVCCAQLSEGAEDPLDYGIVMTIFHFFVNAVALARRVLPASLISRMAEQEHLRHELSEIAQNSLSMDKLVAQAHQASGGKIPNSRIRLNQYLNGDLPLTEEVVEYYRLESGAEPEIDRRHIRSKGRASGMRKLQKKNAVLFQAREKELFDPVIQWLAKELKDPVPSEIVEAFAESKRPGTEFPTWLAIICREAQRVLIREASPQADLMAQIVDPRGKFRKKDLTIEVNGRGLSKNPFKKTSEVYVRVKSPPSPAAETAAPPSFEGTVKTAVYAYAQPKGKPNPQDRERAWVALQGIAQGSPQEMDESLANLAARDDVVAAFLLDPQGPGKSLYFLLAQGLTRLQVSVPRERMALHQRVPYGSWFEGPRFNEQRNRAIRNRFPRGLPAQLRSLWKGRLSQSLIEFEVILAILGLGAVLALGMTVGFNFKLLFHGVPTSTWRISWHSILYGVLIPALLGVSVLTAWIPGAIRLREIRKLLDTLDGASTPRVDINLPDGSWKVWRSVRLRTYIRTFYQLLERLDFLDGYTLLCPGVPYQIVSGAVMNTILLNQQDGLSEAKDLVFHHEDLLQRVTYLSGVDPLNPDLYESLVGSIVSTPHRMVLIDREELGLLEMAPQVVEAYLEKLDQFLKPGDRVLIVNWKDDEILSPIFWDKGYLHVNYQEQLEAVQIGRLHVIFQRMGDREANGFPVEDGQRPFLMPTTLVMYEKPASPGMHPIEFEYTASGEESHGKHKLFYLFRSA